MYASFVARGRRYGSTAIWTDAISGLNSTLTDLDARKIVLLDWGMHDSLRLVSQGELPLTMGLEPFMTNPPPNMREIAAQLITEDGSYFVDHTKRNRVFPEVRRNFDGYIDRAGFSIVPTAIVPDRRGEPVFEVFCVQSRSSPRSDCRAPVD
jgi:hypothetical protein